METRLTELLGVEHPVMLAGMGGVSYAALVAAVSACAFAAAAFGPAARICSASAFARKSSGPQCTSYPPATSGAAIVHGRHVPAICISTASPTLNCGNCP